MRTSAPRLPRCSAAPDLTPTLRRGRYLTHNAILDALVTALLFIPPAVVLVYNLKLCCPKLFCVKFPSAPLAPLLRSVNAESELGTR